MFLQKNFSAAPQPWFRIVGVGALVCFSMIGFSQVTPSAGGYLMRVKYVRGQVLKYTNTISMLNSKAQSSKPMILNSPAVVQVQDVKNGKANLLASVGPMTMGGQQVQPKQVVTISVDSRNTTEAGSQLVGTTLPLKPVKVGDTWSTMAPIPAMPGGGSTKTMKATYRFQGVKAVGGKSVAVIGFTITGGATGSGTLLILASDGTVLTNTARLTVNVGSMGTFIVNSEFKRV